MYYHTKYKEHGTFLTLSEWDVLKIFFNLLIYLIYLLFFNLLKILENKNKPITLKELMAQCKFCDYLQKIVSLIIISNKIERFFFFSRSFEFGKNVILKISGRLLIGQNDSLGVLLLVDICIENKSVEMTWPILLGANLSIGLWILIHCNALI